MEDTRFWQLIESGGEEVLHDQERQREHIREELVKLKPDEINDFHRIFNEKLIAAYSWDLWLAAYWITGGCFDEGFLYFRSWLISRGQLIYEDAIADPDSLANVIDTERDDYEFESLWRLPAEVYLELSDEEIPADDIDWPDAPRGTRIDIEDRKELDRCLPNLAKVCSDCQLSS